MYLSIYTKYLQGGKRSGSWYAFYCPWCDGDRKKMHFRVNPSTGGYCCMRCKSDPSGKGTGSAYSFAKLMGETEQITPDTNSTYVIPQEDDFDSEKAQEVYTGLIDSISVLLPEHKEYLERRGFSDPENNPCWCRSTNGTVPKLLKLFSDDYLVASGLFYKPADSDRAVPRSILKNDRLLIPYKDKNLVKFLRSRDMIKRGPDEYSIKYLSPKGSSAAQWIWGRIDPNKPLIVTEGEFKAMLAYQRGFNCVALPGMNTSHKTFSTICSIKQIKNVIICFDTQVDGQKYVDDAANALAREIWDRKSDVKVYRAHLPLSPDVDEGAKMDIDSYIVRFGTKSFRDVIDDSVEIKYTSETQLL